MNYKRLEFTVCHRLPQRSFFWKGRQFPVCARCTGIHIGYLSLFLFLFNIIHIPFWWSVFMIIPTYVDGMTQAFCKRESTNWLRVITGFLAGVGIMSIISIVGQSAGFHIVKYFVNQ